MDMRNEFKFGSYGFYNRKILFFVSLLFMVLSVFSCVVSGLGRISPFVLGTTDNVVSTETELVNVVNNVAESAIIILNKDITLIESLVIPVDKNITLTSNNNAKFYKLIGANGKATITVNGILALKGIIVTHRTESSGRGVTINTGGKFVMISGEVSGNSDVIGGGVYVYYGMFDMSGGMITNNIAVTNEREDSAQTMEQHSSGNKQHSGVISANSASSMGGGVYVGYDSSFSMSGGVISNNEAALDGGGVYVDVAGSISMTGESVIANNKAVRHGGGVYANGGSFRIAGRAVIVNNTATHRGGGINIKAGPFSMGGGLIANNTAGTGGGVYMSLGSLSTMYRGEISGNIAIGTMEVSGGGGVYNEGNFAMSGGVITNNTAYNFGGGVYNNDNFKLSGEGKIYDNTALRGDNIYHYNRYNVERYIIPISSVGIVMSIVVSLCLYLRKKPKKNKHTQH